MRNRLASSHGAHDDGSSRHPRPHPGATQQCPPPSSARRRARRSRTPTRNDGSAPHAANSATGPSSGTADTSNSSSASTSSTTTHTDRTAASANAHPTGAKSSRTGPANRSDHTPPAADSSTNTAKQPELPTTANTTPAPPDFDAPAPHHTIQHQRRRWSPNTRTRYRHRQVQGAAATDAWPQTRPFSARDHPRTCADAERPTRPLRTRCRCPSPPSRRGRVH